MVRLEHATEKMLAGGSPKLNAKLIRKSVTLDLMAAIVIEC